MTLKEYLRDQASHIRSEAASREANRDRWIAAVSELLNQLESWLGESDSEKLLKTERRPLDLTEEAIGRDTAPSLLIWIGSRIVSIEPVAFHVVGPMKTPEKDDWTGRVDMVADSEKAKIYRFTTDNGEDRWFVLDERTYEVVPLTQATFDTALVGLLS